MDCRELKKAILDGSLDVTFLIMCCDDDFIANQYASAIASSKGLTVRYVESVGIIPQAGPFSEGDDSLYVLHTDKMTKRPDGAYRNAVIICKESDDPDAVSIPAPTEEQTLDYMKARCPGLSDEDVRWIHGAAKGDIRRIDKELDKLALFDKGDQGAMLSLLRADGNYSDMTDLSLYGLANAILRNDRAAVLRAMPNLKGAGIDGMRLVTVLKKNVRNVIDVQFNPSATPERLGMKPNQFYTVRRCVGRYSNDRLIQVYEFLTSVDRRLKSGLLTLSDDRLVDYVLCNVM